MSYLILLYEKVYSDFAKQRKLHGDLSKLPTPVFFYGLEEGEEVAIEIELGKTLIIKYVALGNPTVDGKRTVFFELNGQPRDITVIDHSLENTIATTVKADAGNAKQVGASMPGMVVNVSAKVGDKIKKGDKLLTLEAMKMESTIYAEVDGEVAEVLVCKQVVR